jgi:hypothetical protein
MFFDPQAGLMVKQAVEHMRGLVCSRGNDLRVIWAELVGDVGVEGNSWLIAVTGIDFAERLTVAASPIILPIRR